MKVEMTQKVNINRSVWGLVGGNTKNNDPIEPTLISRSFLIWGQDWGQDLPRLDHGISTQILKVVSNL
tara:strand:+ start:270 stop:473 length:204 start_codon:yes stop_codon:yes gene_type:complete